MDMKKISFIINKLKHSVLLLPYYGWRFRCPFCGYIGGRLLPFGQDSEAAKTYHIVGSGRRNVVCPGCGSHDRERLVYIYLHHIAHLAKVKSAAVLHIAPEPRLARRIMRHPQIEYTCGDLFVPGYKYPEYVHHMNLTRLPFEDAHFDVVLCNHVLEHIADDRQAMREICRVLKPDGFAMLQVPISFRITTTQEDLSPLSPDERLRRFGQKHHFRFYGADYPQRLRECGLDVEIFNLCQHFPHAGLNPEERIFIARPHHKQTIP